MLMKLADFSVMLPIYMNKAALSEDPVERMKYTMCANLSWFYYMQMYCKPLNPILGETYQCVQQDGTRLYLEQTSHHPPRSHFIADGPNGNFSMNGYLEYEIYAGLQSSTVKCHGFKEVNFKDGTKIKWNQNDDYLSGLFIGTMLH